MSTARSVLRRWWVVIALAGVFVVAAVLIGPRDGGLPLDPRSTAPLGTAAVVEVLRRLGVEVRLDVAEPADAAVALLLRDDASEARRRRLLEWVGGGGRLIVADPSSPLVPEVVGRTTIAFTDPPLTPSCDWPPVAPVEEVDTGGDAVYAAPAGTTGCFERNDGHWLVAEPHGAGTVVALGGAYVLTNGALGDADHGVLAVALLSAGEGTTTAFVGGGAAVGEPPAALALLPDGVRWALLQAAVVWVLVVAWRGRRFGAVVPEELEVALPASATVVGYADLLRRAGRPQAAAAHLRERLAAELAARHGLAPHADASAIASAAAASTPVTVDRIEQVLAGPLPANDLALVTYAREVHRLAAPLRSGRSGHAGQAAPLRSGRSGQEPLSPGAPL